MRLLITGATGYLGLHVAEAAAGQGHEIHALVRPSSDTARLRRRVPGIHIHCADDSYGAVAAAVSAAAPDVVHHLASDVRATCDGDGIARHVAANVTFGTQLCQALAERGGGCLVNAGTYWEYDADGGYAPNSLYAATKRAMQDVMAHFVRNAGLKAATLVLYDIYGPGDWRGKLLPSLARAIADGTPMSLTAGEQRLDMVHVADAARGFLMAGDRLAAGTSQGVEVWSLAGGTLMTLREVVALLCRRMERPDTVVWGGRPYPSHQIFQPATTLPVLPGWRPQIDLSDGLAQLACETQRQPAAAPTASRL